jgi:FkbM family methyltransferase
MRATSRGVVWLRDWAGRRARRLLWSRTAALRAARENIALGPDDFCFALQKNWGVAIDAGVGHTPTFAPWIQERTGAFVVLCDPTPKHLSGLRTWVAAHARCALIEKAVAPRDGSVEFFESAQEESGSVDVTHINRRRDGRVVSVPAISLGSLLDLARGHGELSLVKLDLEGGEFPIFLDEWPSAQSQLSRCPQWLVEFHPIPQTSKGFSSVARVRRSFRQCGFLEFSPNGLDYLFYKA